MASTRKSRLSIEAIEPKLTGRRRRSGPGTETWLWVCWREAATCSDKLQYFRQLVEDITLADDLAPHGADEGVQVEFRAVRLSLIYG